MKIVLDTNQLISAILTPDGKPAMIPGSPASLPQTARNAGFVFHVKCHYFGQLRINTTRDSHKFFLTIVTRHITHSS